MSNFKVGDRVIFAGEARGLVGVVTYASQKKLQVDFGYQNGWITTFRQKDGRREPRDGVDLYIRLATPAEIRRAAKARLRATVEEYLRGAATVEAVLAEIGKHHLIKEEIDA